MDVNKHIGGCILIRDVIYGVVVVDLFRPDDNAWIYIGAYFALCLLSFFWRSKIRKFLACHTVTNTLTMPGWYGKVSRLMDGITIAFILVDSLSPLWYAILVFVHLAVTIRLLLRKKRYEV